MNEVWSHERDDAREGPIPLIHGRVHILEHYRWCRYVLIPEANRQHRWMFTQELGSAFWRPTPRGPAPRIVVRSDVLKGECPRCRAEEGAPCKRARGDERASLHAERWSAARARIRGD
jgi:hypothetical protein